MSDLEDGELVDSDSEGELNAPGPGRSDVPAGRESSVDGVAPPNTPNIGNGPENRLNSMELSRATSSYLYRSGGHAGTSSSESESDNSDDCDYFKNAKKKRNHGNADSSSAFVNPLLGEKRKEFNSFKTVSAKNNFADDSNTMDTSDETSNSTANATKRKINNVWGAVMDEQTLTSNLGGFEVIKDDSLRQQSDRNVEFYDYTKRELDDRPDLEDSDIVVRHVSDDPFDEVIADENNEENSSNNANFRKRKMADRIGRKNAKSRLGVRSYDKSRSRSHIEATSDDSLAKVVNCIVNQLNEKKVHLIARIVEKIGKKKALEILYETEDVEMRGGMMTMNLARRRTPGGVYIQLLKTDPNITEVDIKEIFAEEWSEENKSKKRFKKAQRSAKIQERYEKLRRSVSIEDTVDSKEMPAKHRNEVAVDDEMEAPPSDGVLNDDKVQMELEVM